MHKLNVCKVLHVFLDDQTYNVEIFGEDYMKRFIGARGITSYLLYRDVKKGIDPLGRHQRPHRWPHHRDRKKPGYQPVCQGQHGRPLGPGIEVCRL